MFGLEASSSHSSSINCWDLSESKKSIPLAIFIILTLAALAGIAMLLACIVSYQPPVLAYVGVSLAAIHPISVTIMSCILSSTKTRALAEPSSGARTSQTAFSSSIIPLADSKPIVERTDSGLPDEICLTIFQRLAGKDLAAVSGVCFRWHKVASDSKLWEQLCLLESICPFGGRTIDFKNLYRESQLRKQQITQEVRWKIPFQLPTKEFEKTVYLLGEAEGNNIIYNFSMHHFEVWDLLFRKRVCGKEVKEIYRVQYKTIGEIAYLIGKGAHSRLYVYRLCLKTHTFLPTFTFQYTPRYDNRLAFELTEREAFIGHDDGRIAIWDIEEASKLFPDLYFEEDPRYKAADEREWQDSFNKTEKISTKSLLFYEGQEAEITVGERIRLNLDILRKQYLMLQNQKYFEGHTQNVTSVLHCGNSLFSSSLDGTVRQWDLTTRQCVRIIKTDTERPITKLKVAGPFLFWPC